MRAGHLSEVFASFQGEGLYAGARHLFVRLSGCNLRCRYCDTPDSLEREPEYTVCYDSHETIRGGNPVSPEQLTALLAPFCEGPYPLDGMAITGGEPLLQAAFLRDWLRGSDFPMPKLLETSGVLPAALGQVLDLIDIVSMDIKLPSNSGEPAFWEVHDEFAKLAIRKELYVKVLVDARTRVDEVERAAEMVARLPRPVPLFVQPIVGTDGRLTAGDDSLTHFYMAARRWLTDVRVRPQIHKLLGIR